MTEGFKFEVIMGWGCCSAGKIRAVASPIFVFAGKLYDVFGGNTGEDMWCFQRKCRESYMMFSEKMPGKLCDVFGGNTGKDM